LETKKVILNKKIDGTRYRILPKTSADIVTFDDEMSVKEKILSMEDNMVSVEYVTETIDKAVEKSVEETVTETIEKTVTDTIEATVFDGGEI